MISTPPDLSLIIVAYNSADLLRATLSSVVQYTHDITYELIVIDNASSDTSVAAVAREFPAVRLIRNQRNLGFAVANNRGIRLSSGRYVGLLNPDTLLRDDALSALVRRLDADPQVGAVGPQLLQPDGTAQRYSYGDAPSPGYLLRRRLARLRGRDLHDWRGTQSQRVDWVAGTCLIVRRAAIEAAGLLDEQFFLYFEDVDWGVRLNQAGWPIVFVPTTAIVHIGGGSVGRGSSPHYDRSLVRLYAKHYGGLSALGVWSALRLYRLVQRGVSHARRLGARKDG